MPKAALVLELLWDDEVSPQVDARDFSNDRKAVATQAVVKVSCVGFQNSPQRYSAKSDQGYWQAPVEPIR